jgi:hypothetical protein
VRPGAPTPTVAGALVPACWTGTPARPARAAGATGPDGPAPRAAAPPSGGSRRR